MRFLKIFRPVSLLAAALAAGSMSLPVWAQTAQNRVTQAVTGESTFVLPGSVNPRVAAQFDVGRMNAGAPIDGITMSFALTGEQRAELDALVQAQQTPGSPEYHQWLTPATYANLFGLSSADIAKVAGWLTSQGFTIERVANSRTSITFSGTAGQVEAAFGTEMHRYTMEGETHFANATNVSVPPALAGVVLGIRNLDDFRPQPQVRFHRGATAGVTPRGDFTSSQSGAHFLTPDDVTTIYDMAGAYNSGDNGSGQTIAVLGQSQIAVADVEAFQSAAGLTVKDPTITLVPDTGTSAVAQGDEAESDLDLEYAGATGRGATIDFIYAGNNSNSSVYDAMQYAVENRIGTILSLSYGTCELDLSQSQYAQLDQIVEQGASQGQSLIVAAGDAGSTACWATPGMTTAQQETPSANYPASSAYATGLGGTEFPAADAAAGNTTYWQAASGSDVLSSALSYIPEVVWNDDSAAAGKQDGAADALASGGGGPSIFASRPSWQTGVTGIATGKFRLTPDVSLDSSAVTAGYLYCTSDHSAWSSGQAASCNSGFRDATSGYLTVAGGTSFATPIFAGMVSILNQKVSSSGEGVVAAALYPLAANGATYASAFHDIVMGTNACTAGSTYCSTAGKAEFSATAGYDEASGLGSVDFGNLMGVWTGATTTGGGGGNGSFKLAATNVTVSPGSSGASTVTITSVNSYAGTVGFAVTAGNGSLTTSGCYAISNTAVTAGSTATATLTVYSSTSTCSGTGVLSFAKMGGAVRASLDRGTGPGDAAGHSGGPLGKTIPLSAAALAGVLLLGFRRMRSGARALVGCLVLAVVVGFASGCGSSSGTTTTTTTKDVAAGTYTVTVAGTDTTTSSITASTSFTVTVN
ncbi:MAG TPA: S53 family peptidase [Acidobacteriaceae bacterium]|jgi:subtilase family serine protease|nr:S53 family peptidase [Acidobacteriaceae bacterium]